MLKCNEHIALDISCIMRHVFCTLYLLNFSNYRFFILEASMVHPNFTQLFFPSNWRKIRVTSFSVCNSIFQNLLRIFAHVSSGYIVQYFRIVSKFMKIQQQ